MTEKKSDLWEESSLSKEEQMQLGNEEEFFRKSSKSPFKRLFSKVL